MSNIINKIPIISSVHATLTEASKLTQQATPLIEELNSALDALGAALHSEDHSVIRSAAATIAPMLQSILDKPYKENFKNGGLIGVWSTYLQPLTNLLTLLDLYLGPGLAKQQPTISRLQQAVTPAKNLIQGEVDYQQGLGARAVHTAWNQVERIAQKTSRKFIETAAPSEADIEHHPLVQLSQLIGTYLTHGEDYLPASRENHLATALRRLEQRSPFFTGIKTFVYAAIEEGKLHENLESLVLRLSEFIEAKEKEEIYVFLYHKALESNQVSRRAKTEAKMGQIAWGKHHVQEQGLAGLQKLWLATAEFDEIEELRTLGIKLTAAVKTPAELSQKIDLALDFFQKDPGSKLGQETVEDIAPLIAGWLSILYSWTSQDLDGSEFSAQERRLNHLKQQINRGKYLEALTEFKEELQKSPLMKKVFEDKNSDSVSPIITIQELKDKQAKTLNPKHEIETASWKAAMHKEKERLVDQIGYLATFKTIYTVLGAPTTKTNPLEFQKESNNVYARVLAAVEAAAPEKQQNTFISKVQEEIENRKDLSFFSKMQAKLAIWIVLFSVRFFTKHFIHSFTDYLTNTLSLPMKQPLSTLHLNPVERINECFIAQKKALRRWAEDVRGEDFGPLSRKKALEVALRAPDLNGGYKQSELIDQTIRCAIDQFLTMKGIFSSPFFSANRSLENWTNSASSTLGYGIRLTLSLIPQIAITSGYLVGKVSEQLSAKILRFAAKQFMTRLNIAPLVLDSMKDSLYKQSQYTHAIDEVLLEQLREIENLLDQGGGEAIEHEGEAAKNTFREAVANALSVIDLNRNLTSEGVHQAQSPHDNVLSEAIAFAKEAVDEELRNAIVQLLIIMYQSILTEDQMNTLILKIFKKTNDNLLPQTAIQMYYSQKKKEAFAQKLGHKPTDAELKAEFARKHRRAVTDVSDADIEALMKIKFNKTEQSLRETAFRVIKKSVHEAVQEKEKSILMTADQAVIKFLDFMDRHLFENPSLRSTNFFIKSDKLLKEFELATNEDEREKALKALHQCMIELLQDYEKKQRLLDSKAASNTRTTAHIRRINEMSNRVFLKELIALQNALQKFLFKKDIPSLKAVRQNLKNFKESVYGHQIEFERIQQAAHHLETVAHPLSEQACIWGNKLITYGASIALNQVEFYANLRLNQIADGAFHLYKDPNTFESFLRHVVMLNFIESLGYHKDLKA